MSKILPILTYAALAWLGFCTKGTLNQMEAVLRKAVRLDYYSTDKPSLDTLLDNLDKNLFQSIISNPNHCLGYLLPPKRSYHYNLRDRGHNYVLPKKDDRNFMIRCLFKLL